MAEQQGASEQDDVSFLRTDDMVCLTCTSTTPDNSTNGQRVCLAAEGFGNRMCFLQEMGNKDVPLDISICVFVLEQALSVRALQEMVTATTDGETGRWQVGGMQQAGQSGGHRTLLYGHAVLLRHSHSNMYLSSLSTSSSNDKLAFDVGLREIPQGESCWWTIHPASKQRSEGEKVRVGDDLILVSVASERYLHIGGGNMVIASFQQTQWMVQPVCSGAIRLKSLGFVFGGDVLRFFHGHMDECLTIPHRDSDNVNNSVMYETGAVCSQARSLWRLEHVRTKWAGGFMGWMQPCRLRHITSGRYLCVTNDNQVVTIHRSQATERATSFVLKLSKDDRKHSDSREDEGMGTADIKYGDTIAFIQHLDTGLWLSYQTFETKKRGVGRVEEKKAVMLVEGHMDDGLTFSRAQEEESRSARVIRKCTSLFSRFIKALDFLRVEGQASAHWSNISLDDILMCLEDLIEYFKQPSEDEGHEERQVKLKALRNRQDLFQEEGMVALILETIDKFSHLKSQRHFAHLAGEEAANKWDEISGYLYLLLAAMITGNRANCSQFAQSNRLDWLVNRLESQQSSTGVLDVLHCVLIDSPEALNMIKEQHIRTIISLIDKHGRDPKVLHILCSLCIGNNVAVRANQNLICDNLLPGRDLLLQTKLVDHVTSMSSNTYVGLMEGSAQYRKWYFEVIIDNITMVTHIKPFLRIGWANTEGFCPYPGGGDGWGACGVGDDLFSYAFDGVNIWTAARPKPVRTAAQQFQKGDIIGCALDLTVPQISFTVNGVKVKGFFRDFNLDGLFYPVVSTSAYCSFRFMLGGEHGKLKHGPPREHAPCVESLLPKEKLQILPCFHFGDVPKGIVCGPQQLVNDGVFVPLPVETTHIQLPIYIENVRDKLAENIHESWATGKIEQGWTFGERRDDHRMKHPCLTTFERLPRSERQYNLTLAYETLRTLLALGYHMTYDPQKINGTRIKTLKLPNNYLQSNGYKPSPLDLTGMVLNEKMEDLVDMLAENTHNVWAKDRIKQGWTYGLNEDMHTRRSPHLVPYEKVDPSIKKANSEVSSETVKTLMAYGYNLEPPTNEAGESAVAREITEKKQPTRTYRAGLNYAVTSGKWYYEFEVLVPGLMKCGWAKVSASADQELGMDGTSYVFEGYTGRKWNQGSEPFGKIWQAKDVIGCMIDMQDRTISFSLNGELMMDPMGQEITYKGIDVDTGYVPAFSIGNSQQAKLNFGQDYNTLKFFTCCGLQEGYEPFCVNMTRQMALWYSKKQPTFHPIQKSHPGLEVLRIAGGSSTPPCLKVMSKTFGTLDKVRLEFMRLSLPVCCQHEFVSPRSKSHLILKDKKKTKKSPRDYEDESGGENYSDNESAVTKPPKIITALHRGLSEDDAESRRTSFKKGEAKSFDGVLSRSGQNGGMKRGSSETHLSHDTLTLPKDKQKSGSKFSLLDKFADVSKAVHDKNSANGMKKSKFSSIFRRSRSRDPSPQPKKLGHGQKSKTLPLKYTASEGEYTEEESDQESLLGGGGTSINVHPPAIPPEFGVLDPRAKNIPKSTSEVSFGSQYISETEQLEMEAMMSAVDEYYYGVRIFPGQDPAHVYVGWVTPGYHMHSREFDMKSIRNVVVCSLDIDYKLKSSMSRKNCYIVSAGDLQNRYGQNEADAKLTTPGLLIGCFVDTSTGVMSFTVNGKEVANKFQVEPGTKLFPAAFFEPTNKEVLQFELGRTKTTLPLSAVLFREGKHVTPQCPPRLDLQVLNQSNWSRVPNQSLAVHTLKLSDIRGWSLLCEKPVAMLAVYIPEEDRCLDILELIEYPELLKFHAETLELYKSVCSHGNHRAAHELVNHTDERQLMFCIQSDSLSGPLRMGFHNILISLHLETNTKSRLMTQNEFIIPLAFEEKQMSLAPKEEYVDPREKIREAIPTLEHSVSIRPNLDDASRFPESSKDLKLLVSPSFPLDKLKKYMMQALADAVLKGAAHIRDPVGGSNSYLFVPLLKVCDNLLVMGLLDDQDLQQLLCLIDPSVFDKNYEIVGGDKENTLTKSSGQSKVRTGLLDMKLDEAVKLQLCYLLQHLCDCSLRHRVEAIISFSDDYVLGMQKEQLQRYSDVKQSNMSPAVAAKKTKEFRCPPEQQMRFLLSFKKLEADMGMCPMSDEQKAALMQFHTHLLNHCGHQMELAEEEETAAPQETEMSWSEKLLQLVMKKSAEKKEDEEDKNRLPSSFQQLITNTMIKWSQADFIQDVSLIREMFSLIHRQYDGVGEIIRALEKTYVISKASREDISNLLKALGTIRALLSVQVDPVEEDLLKNNIWDVMDNKVFFQHPDLMRALSVHETVMQLMVNTLNNAKQRASSAPAANFAESGANRRRSSVQSNVQELTLPASSSKDPCADMVVSCCRFLCYFCRTSRQNQRAMFEHLGYLLENSCMLLARPSLRGSCPLDVAYSSLMDNNELALALRENDLEKVAIYLARCGIQTNQELHAAGYPDIGWDPVEGERFLDFFRFCVWVNGESVEENANLVVRLLIRRPECLGPALRGAGGGLLKAMKDGIIMSEQIAASRETDSAAFLIAVSEYDDSREHYLRESKYNFDSLPPEDDEDYIDMGGAILNFYSSLVELLGKCAPDAETIKAGKTDSLRARAILRSLVSMSDLEGVLRLRFILPVTTPHEVVNEEGVTEIKATAGLPPGLLPIHKGSIVQFLERVYGIPDQATFFRLLGDSFLPDLRAATLLDSANASESDMALALNRYLCSSVILLLTGYAHFFSDADHASELLDQTLSTSYRLSKCRSLTKIQQETVSDFLVALTSQLRPPMMTKLLRKLTHDVPALTENSVVALRVLTNHYERCGRYYGSGGMGGHGIATDEERQLTMMLFSGIFDSLAKRAYDPELFSKALPCLSAIGCALSPDYSLSNQSDHSHRHITNDVDYSYSPNPVDTARTPLTEAVKAIIREFVEHYHDAWALQKVEQGWTYGSVYDEDKKHHPSLLPYGRLSDKEKGSKFEPVEQNVKSMLAWGWTLDQDHSSKSSFKRKVIKSGGPGTDSSHGYSPCPVDLRNINVTREMQSMADTVARNSHEIWAVKKKAELELVGGGVHPQFVAYEVLTDKEKKPERERSLELIRFLQLYGYRLHSTGKDLDRKRESASRTSKDSQADSGVGVSSTEKRFAYSLLEKLLEYVDKAALNLNQIKPSTNYSRRNSYSTATEDVKFFGKVVLPLVERYFRAHKNYFITIPNSPQSSTATASVKEKEMTASLFCKLSGLLRQRINAFGHDVAISVRCLQKLVQAIDARAVVKSSPEIVRSSLLPFFTNAADDLQQTVNNLKIGRFSHVKGTITRGATSLNYVHMVLLPVLSSMFEHLSRHHFGPDLLVGDQQLCCYKILNALYVLGTNSAAFVQRDTVNQELARHRPTLGECLASFASTFPVAFLEPQNNKFNKNSILFGIAEDKISTHSLEAHEVMNQLAENLPSLEKIISEIDELAKSGGKYDEAPHVIEVTLPMLCSYLPAWWCVGPDNLQGQTVTNVTADLMNNVLGNVLKLIKSNIGAENAPWMNRIATRTQPIIANATLDMLQKHILPVAAKLRDNASRVSMMEEMYLIEKRARHDVGEMEATVQEHFHILVRDIYASYPLLIKYVDLHRSHWLKNPCFDVEQLYMCVADVFNLWSKSQLFKREEQNFVTMNEIDNRALIMPSQDHKHASMATDVERPSQTDHRKKRKDKRFRQETYTSLNVACLKRLLPIGLNLFGGREQELIQQAKQKLIQESEGDIKDFLQMKMHMEEKTMDEKNHWQKMLYKKIGSKQVDGVVGAARERSIDEVLAMSKVLQGLHLVEHPPSSVTSAWKKIVSSQRKRCIMACFRMVPLYNLPRHRAINLFLKSHREQWLSNEDPGHATLIEDITGPPTEAEVSGEKEEAEEMPHSLGQLITAFSRAATTEQKQSLSDDFLYVSYAQIMSNSCSGEDEDDDDEGDEDASKSFQEQEMEKQKLLYEQSRLSDRGAAEMMLLYISASKGEWSDNVVSSIDLGISLLRGGNTSVQKRMLLHLQDKKDVGFFTSVSGLMQQCSVLDLDAFERCNKAEGLGMTAEGSAGVKNLHDAELTCKLFRFLQLLCEGHNLDFQNYLRTQAGNTTTVNIIICTVDYLLRLQESIMDFYWHYSGKESIDPSGKENFCRAICVAKQVFTTITEYIQGPCSLNQLALAHSRLWDAVGGFLYIFAHMQEKLSKDPEQLELLREFMKLQKEMMIMLLSMLEGNVMNGPIGKQMVDTLVESSANFEMILRFFDIFLKMKDLTTSEAFMEFDINKDGVISHKEFRRAMEVQKIYSEEEIEYIMMCVDSNQDGKVDFNEFTDRFHNPAKDIGFNVAVLLTNLSEHMPNDSRLERFMEKAKSVLDYFEPYLGRIEIMGSAGRIERVYFEITQSYIDQWEKPQIKESKRSFLHSVVNEGGDKEKLESFVNFCEDSIFEMQHATSISAEEQAAQYSQMEALRTAAGAKQEQDHGGGGVMEVVGNAYSETKNVCAEVLCCFRPSSIRSGYHALRSMTFTEMLLSLFRLNRRIALMLLQLVYTVFITFVKFILAMMYSDPSVDRHVHVHVKEHLHPTLTRQVSTADGYSQDRAGTTPDKAKDDPSQPPGLQAIPEASEDQPYPPDAPAPGSEEQNAPPAPPATTDTAAPNAEADLQYEPTTNAAADSDEEVTLANEPPIEFKEPATDIGKLILSVFARNFYNFKILALGLAFAINLFLLFFKVTAGELELSAEAPVDASNATDGSDDEDIEEWVSLADSLNYLGPVLRGMAVAHSIIAFSMLVAYYCLKVPLVIFKREKEIARKLEFEGLWVAEQPSDDIKGHWDKLVLSTPSFPDFYWDKFVKKKVRNKYSEQYDYDSISNLLGMEKGDSLKFEIEKPEPNPLLPSFLADVDWQYQIWKWGVIFTDNSFLYIAWYFSFSVLGNFNYFFFAAHLLDVAICIKTLGAILQSVTHNGKQLVLTVMLLSIIVYLYTVIAFNFFRKFYVQEEEGQKDLKCHDMFTCFVFHLYKGVRAGGGIGDEISPPDGDPYETWRILFDITFFFFVVVILLAIIQGLIIDAFGELRDQLEQVKEDMESNCFICGIGKDYFDKVPHGFDVHVKNEHDFANYMFFLMHLINKPDTDYTGQETYVWELYRQRKWDFFPVGDCFRKQYEDESQSS